MSFSYEGPNGTVTVSGEGQTLCFTDDFNRADGGSGAAWSMGGEWGISRSRSTEEPVGSLTGCVIHAGVGRTIGSFGGQPLLIPDEAVVGDVVTWEIRGSEITVRIGDPPSNYDDDDEDC